MSESETATLPHPEPPAKRPIFDCEADRVLHPTEIESYTKGPDGRLLPHFGQCQTDRPVRHPPVKLSRCFCGAILIRWR